MKIVSLQASNVKRLQAVEIRPDGNTVIVGGKNGAGKTSVLDSIAAALGGARLCPKVPIRKGQDSAEAVVELGDDLIVIRRWTQAGSTLHVETRDGARHRKPQQILDGLVGRLTFDPLEFSRKSPRDQLITVQEHAGLDFSDLDGKRQKAFENRTEVNRSLKSARAKLECMPFNEDVPAAPVSVTDLMRELEERRTTNRANDDRRRGIERRRMALREDLDTAKQHEAAEIADAERLRAELETEIADARARLDALESRLETSKQTGTASVNAAKQAAEKAAVAMAAGELELDAERDALVDLPTDDLVASIEGAEDVNRRLRENEQHQSYEKIVADLGAQSEGLTEQITNLDMERLARVEAAEFPVPGLGVSDDGVTLNGLPLEQASSAEQLRTSVAMGIALNSRLRVLLIRDGSLLDHESLALLQTLADEADVQLWIERVGGDGASVVIEDGMVAGAVPEKTEDQAQDDERQP